MRTVHYSLAFIAVWIAYATVVILLIVKSAKYERKQLIAQSMIAILIPIFGALFVHGMHRAANGNVEKRDRGFTRDEHGFDDGRMLPNEKD